MMVIEEKWEKILAEIKEMEVKITETRLTVVALQEAVWKAYETTKAKQREIGGINELHQIQNSGDAG